jgi:hypothetical protein
MTRKELNVFRQDFRKFLLDNVNKYNPTDAELRLMYTHMIQALNTDMNSWFAEELENEKRGNKNV